MVEISVKMSRNDGNTTQLAELIARFINTYDGFVKEQLKEITIDHDAVV